MAVAGEMVTSTSGTSGTAGELVSAGLERELVSNVGELILTFRHYWLAGGRGGGDKTIYHWVPIN